MSADTEPCDRCGHRRKLQAYKVNNTAWNLCAECIGKDKAVRSKAATGTAGRPAKSPSQLDDQLFRIMLNSADARVFEAWLRDQGYEGTRSGMLKAFALATIKAARKR